MSSIVRRMHELWVDPLDPRVLAGPRLVAMLTAMWLLLSRAGRFEWSSWPSPIFEVIPDARLLRYLLIRSNETAELVLYGALILCLLLVAMNRWSHLAAPIAGILLYRFAGIETIFEIPGPYRQGLGQVVLILVILTAVGRFEGEPSSRARWGLTLIRIVVASRYLNAGLAKLHVAGFGWIHPDNMSGVAAVFATFGDPVFGKWMAFHPLAASCLGGWILIVELFFILAVGSRNAANVLLPAALLSHILQFLFFGMFEQALPLLLVFLPWERWLSSHGLAEVV